MRKAIIGGLIGWSSIVALAWWLAEQRITICMSDRECILRATAARDAVLVWGPAVALVCIVVAALFSHRAARIDPATRTASQAPTRRLR